MYDGGSVGSIHFELWINLLDVPIYSKSSLEVLYDLENAP